MKKLPALVFCLLLTAALLTVAAPTAARADMLWDPEDVLGDPAVQADIGINLALVILVELVFAFLCRHRGRALLLVALLNLLTNPIFLILMEFARAWGGFDSLRVYATFVVLWLVAILIEGLIYQISRLDFSRPYAFSLAANALSIGLLLLRVVLIPLSYTPSYSGGFVLN